MTNIKVLERKDTRTKKDIPVKLSIPCSCCNKEIIISRDTKGNWIGKSGKAMKNILDKLEKNEKCIIYCSISCSNKSRDHSYMNKINKTKSILCDDCLDFNCSYRTSGKINKGSISIKCYTKYNRDSESLNEWRNSSENISMVIKNCSNHLRYNRDKNKRIVSIINLNNEIISFDDYSKKFILNQCNTIDFSNLGFKDIKFDSSISKPSMPTLAWEQRLQDIFKNKPWLVYIKYYSDIDGNFSRPLQIGKSGTLSVNQNGTDIRFDLNSDDKRASRQFLIENNLFWDKNKISIKGFKTELEALKFEDWLLDKTNLFS